MKPETCFTATTNEYQRHWMLEQSNRKQNDKMLWRRQYTMNLAKMIHLVNTSRSTEIKTS